MRLLYVFLLISCSLSVSADTSKYTWLNIFVTDKGKDRVTAIPIDSVSDMRFIRHNEMSDFYDSISIVLKNEQKCILSMNDVSEYSLGSNVPTLYITTNPVVSEISSKSEYLSAKFSMNCYGNYEDLDNVSVNIRGRGNSTWGYAKKPYRLKFEKKVSLCGLKKAKSYVLIANYIDNTLMKNAIAFKIGELLNMPYTNHSIPVNVVLNGKFKGAYMLSEKIGINSGSVDIDEEEGIIWEMDSYFDEEYKFKSQIYNLPVMVKDPDLIEIVNPKDGQTAEVAVDELLKKWQADFEQMEASVKTGNPENFIDIEQAVNYLLVNLVALNWELNWPKSVYLFKENAESLYKMGPLWDYDCAFNFQNSFDRKLFLSGDIFVGAKFYLDLIKSEVFKSAFEQKWILFKTELFPQVLEYMDEYAGIVKVSALQNGECWPGTGPDGNGRSSEDFSAALSELKDWLIKRVEFIDEAPYYGFF